MTTEEAIGYIENYGWSTTRLGLERTRELLSLLGDPQKELKFIHVAGSNGKGSCCAMFEQILRNAGYRCGLYTSPYIEDFCERIRVDGRNIPGERLAQITQRVMKLAQTMEDHPSQFELVTAIGMEYFREEHCDIVVLEVGMGGELDSTNVIDAPVLACITNIGLEHTEYLGNTLEAIARTKAGIIKTGCRCVCYDTVPEVTEVIRRVCEERDVPLRCVDFSRLTFSSCDLNGQRFLWSAEPAPPQRYELSLIGKHQLHNAALVLTGIELLQEMGWKISPEDVRNGLRQVRWPARLEVLSLDPVVILDGGHNPQCAQALTESLDLLLPGEKVVFLTGVLRDKDHEQILERMRPCAKEFLCVTPVSERALSGKELAQELRSRHVPARSFDTIEQGIRKALEETRDGSPMVIFGSLYLAGAVRKVFPSILREARRREGIRRRSALTPEERKTYSDRICKRLLGLPAYAGAETIMVYQAVREEADLGAFLLQARQDHKQLVYPRCVDREHILALRPAEDDPFLPGAYKIPEPSAEGADIVEPAQIDLVICPGTVFDENGNRMGMGSGYYDRFLKKCTNACVAAAAFEVQIVKQLPAEAWDRPMDLVCTEQRIIYGKTEMDNG